MRHVRENISIRIERTEKGEERGKIRYTYRKESLRIEDRTIVYETEVLEGKEGDEKYLDFLLFLARSYEYGIKFKGVNYQRVEGSVILTVNGELLEKMYQKRYKWKIPQGKYDRTEPLSDQR